MGMMRMMMMRLLELMRMMMMRLLELMRMRMMRMMRLLELVEFVDWSPLMDRRSAIC